MPPDSAYPSRVTTVGRVRVPVRLPARDARGLAAAVIVLVLVTAKSPFIGLGLGAAALAFGLLATAPALAGLALGLFFWNTSKAATFVASNLEIAGLGVLGLVMVLTSTRIPRIGAAVAGPVVYLALMAPGTLLHPSSQGIKALLVQRPVITAGAVLAGVWLARAGGTRIFLVALYVGSVIVAVDALPGLLAVGGTSPIGLNKNYAGPLLASVVLLRLVPHTLPAPRVARWPHIGLLVIGLGGTQSRSAFLGLIVAALYFVLTDRQGSQGSRALRRLIVVSGASIGAIALYSLISAQLSSDNRFNSAAVRPADAQALLNFFLAHPFLGLGMENIFGISTDSAYGAVTAPALSLQSLAEGGILGGAAFLALMIAPFRVKLGPLSTIVRCLLIARAVEGQFDFYWLGGATALAWLMLGICVAQRDLDEVAAPAGDHAPAAATLLRTAGT